MGPRIALERRVVGRNLGAARGDQDQFGEGPGSPSDTGVPRGGRPQDRASGFAQGHLRTGVCARSAELDRHNFAITTRTGPHADVKDTSWVAVVAVLQTNE